MSLAVRLRICGLSACVQRYMEIALRVIVCSQLQPEAGFGAHVEDKVHDGEVGEETCAGGEDLVVGALL